MVDLAQTDRVRALQRTNLLGAERDAEFDRITRLARRLTGADMALVTLVDDRRQFILSESGLPEPWASRRQTPLSHSICRHTIATDAPLVIEDAREHPLVCDAPAVTELGVHAYAGFPLHSGDGHVLGALCAIGAAPREWSDDQLEALEDLAVTLTSLIGLRETAESSVHLAGQYAIVAHTARAIGELHGDAEVFERIADLAVLDLADMCVVDLLQDGRLQQVASAPRDSRRAALHAERAELLAHAGSDHPAFVALAGATTQPLSAPPADQLPDAELDLYRRLDVGPALLVPLIFHGAPLGVVSLARHQGAPAFSQEDIAVAEAVAHQISAAVSAERLLEEHRNVSELLQRTLLPRELPAIPGMGVATWYEAGDGEMDVGGDFYDVIRRPDGTWMLVIGDVCGRGPGAAAMTGVVRHTLRGLVAHDKIDLPSAIGELNRRLYDETDAAEFVTLAAVGVDFAGERPVVQATLAGHPAPMVVSQDGAVSSVGRPGLALGLYEDAQYTVLEERLDEGDALLMYTDGLTEAHGGRTQFDHEALAMLLAGCGGLPARDIVDRVQRGLFAAEGAPVSDDVAVMAARVAV